MKNGDIYKHVNGNEYLFITIAIPITLISQWQINQLTFHGEINDAGTLKGEEVKKVKLYDFKGFLVIDKDVHCVIYLPIKEKRRAWENVWARSVDDFFGNKINDDGEIVKRFTYICPYSKMD